MFDLQSKVKRQIEILGLCLSSEIKDKSLGFFADYYNVDEITIKRDLQDLRSFGIDIHSRKSIVHIGTIPSPNTLKQVILHYIGLNHTETSIDRSTNLLLEKQKEDALVFIVMLQYCIDNSLKAIISYNKNADEIQDKVELLPLLIFQNEGCWRVLSQSGTKIKQYRLDKITSVKTTDENFVKIDQERINNLFNNSWRSWLAEDVFNVKLLMSKEWAQTIKPRMFIQNQKITTNDDGSIIFEATVNYLGEIASWVVSLGEGCKVLEPEALKKEVIRRAKGVLKNYDLPLEPNTVVKEDIQELNLNFSQINEIELELL